MAALKTLPVHRYSVIFTFIWSFGTGGFNIYLRELKPGLGGVKDVASPIDPHEQTQ